MATDTIQESGESPSSGQANAQLQAQVSAALRNARNADGGWAYRLGKASRVEPTCWALLALEQTKSLLADDQTLNRWPRANGWLVDVAGVPVNHAFNAIAALTLLQRSSTRRLAEALITKLIASKGVRSGQNATQRQNNSLQAWPWVDGTFSWAEPTAWCLIVLKQQVLMGPVKGAAERIRIGEAMLIDRACRKGGWNFGNSNVYGQDLEPYVPTTALALLALQNLRSQDPVRRSVQWLQENWPSERSLMALSLSTICHRAYGLAADAPGRELARLLAERMPSNDDALGLAMALYALSDRPMKAFSLTVS